MSNQIHATDDALELYSLGRLPDRDASELEEHLLVCGKCQERLEQEDRCTRAVRTALTDAGENSRGTDDSGEPHRALPVVKWRWASITIATSVALAAILLLTITLRSPGEPQQLTLIAQRGSAESGGRVRAGRPLKLHVDTTELGSPAAYRLELVNSGGDVLWTETVKPAGASLEATVSRTLAAGQYWLRLYQPGSNAAALREFGITVE